MYFSCDRSDFVLDFLEAIRSLLDLFRFSSIFESVRFFHLAKCYQAEIHQNDNLICPSELKTDSSFVLNIDLTEIVPWKKYSNVSFTSERKLNVLCWITKMAFYCARQLCFEYRIFLFCTPSLSKRKKRKWFFSCLFARHMMSTILWFTSFLLSYFGCFDSSYIMNHV